jgi:hypothetical protein
MELKELIGLHTLSGIDIEQTTKRGEQAEIVRFILDGITYQVEENPDDGYRSNHEGPFISEEPVKNIFPGIQVFCLHDTSEPYGSCDILGFYNMKGEIFLCVGTENIDDYYPSYQGYYSPGELK